MFRVKTEFTKSPTWKSDIVNHPEYRKLIYKAGMEMRARANATLEAEYRTGFDTSDGLEPVEGKSYADGHYGYVRLGGNWGSTDLTWPMSPMARKKPAIIRAAAASLGLKRRS